MLHKFVAVAALGVMLVSRAGADPMVLRATSVFPGALSSFTVTFDDTGDRKLDLAEVTGFSGVTIVGIVGFEPFLVGVPDISGISNCGGASLPGNCSFWVFSSATFTTFAAIGNWTYEVAAVAEPPMLALLAFSLFAAALSRRRRAR
jgi:hypothetical protein